MPLFWPEYELLDFGQGRKLERFGVQVFDRPAPHAEHLPRQHPSLWEHIDAKYHGTKVGNGRWRRLTSTTTSATPSVGKKKNTPSSIACPLDNQHCLQLAIELLPTGQVGVFPEQFPIWQWIVRQVATAREPLKVLNLFGYSGGSTLAAAIAGAEVTHVDASKPAVAAARRNAELSGLAEAPIRWIVEDATKYCQRELKRGQQYHAIILDPPTYGHGPGGEVWRIVADLLPLLKLCQRLTRDDRRFVLATCHTPGIGPAELAAYLAEGLFGHCGQPPKSGRLELTTSNGRPFANGVFAQWPGKQATSPGW